MSTPLSVIATETPKPSEKSPSPSEKHAEICETEKKVTEAFIICSNQVLRRFLDPHGKDFIIAQHYYFGLKGSSEKFLTFLHAKMKFNETLVSKTEPHKRESLRSTMIFALNEMYMEMQEMEARVTQKMSADPKIRFRKDLLKKETTRKIQMNYTDSTFPIFTTSLNELLKKLKNIPWFSPSDLALYRCCKITI
jgi:hypothetical protein